MPERKLSPRHPVDLPAWPKLKEHYRDTMRHAHMRDLFVRDKKRIERFTLDSGDLHLDLSKNLVNATTSKLLTSLAKQAGV
ncbi:MAG: hypothetical protein WBN32_09910, partial [Woeseia sp.]